LWVIFALLDPDSESGSGSADLIESGSETAWNSLLGMTNSWLHTCLADPDLHPKPTDTDPDHRARYDKIDNNLYIFLQKLKSEVFTVIVSMKTLTNPTNLSRNPPQTACYGILESRT
jgi:hypothetical protein